jgi:hypothetical protein
MPAAYFRELIPAQYHTSVPTRPIYVYSFALEPEDFRPSGSVNLSRIDNVKLITKHVEFSPLIAVQPFIATDAVNDIFGMDKVAAAQEKYATEYFKGTHIDGGVKYRGQDGTASGSLYGGSGSSSTGVLASGMAPNVMEQWRMRQMQTALSPGSAVAIHPSKQGNGLFLQQTDGMATAIEGGADLYVYARSKNVLRIKSGMAGLAYAN